MKTFKKSVDIARAMRNKNNTDATQALCQNIQFGILNEAGVQYHLLMGMITSTIDPKNNKKHKSIMHAMSKTDCIVNTTEKEQEKLICEMRRIANSEYTWQNLPLPIIMATEKFLNLSGIDPLEGVLEARKAQQTHATTRGPL